MHTGDTQYIDHQNQKNSQTNRNGQKQTEMYSLEANSVKTCEVTLAQNAILF